MSSKKIILADRDLGYLLRLQNRLIESIDGDVEIESITDPYYFESYFLTPRDAGCLIVSEDLYTEDLSKHNIDSIVVLTETASENDGEGNKIKRVHKYSSLDQIFNQIKGVLTTRLAIDQKTDAEVITFYSASGGMGKTTLSLSMAKYLADRHYRVLYINTESIQSFSYYLKDDRPLPEKTMMTLETLDSDPYEVLKGAIRDDGFSYLPQFPTPLSFYSVGRELFSHLIHAVCISRDYDYIIVDTDSIFDNVITEILKKSDKVFFITNQDESVVNTSARFLSGIDTRPGQYVFICNNYKDNQANKTEHLKQAAVDQYIPHFNEKGKDLIDTISRSDSILKMALMMD